MLLSQHKDLKLEIKSLPEKEKDKLLLRLIAKDKILTEHLHFKLLEDDQDLLRRLDELTDIIHMEIDLLKNSRKQNSKETLLVMRKLNGQINHHAKVTKDLETELELRLLLLNLLPIQFNEAVFSALYKYNEKLMLYFVKTAIAFLNKYDKLHEDLQFDFREELNALLHKIYHHRTAQAAKELGLPENL